MRICKNYKFALLSAVYNSRKIFMSAPLQTSNKAVQFICIHITPELNIRLRRNIRAVLQPRTTHI